MLASQTVTSDVDIAREIRRSAWLILFVGMDRVCSRVWTAILDQDAGPLFAKNDRTRRAPVVRAKERQASAEVSGPLPQTDQVRSELANIDLAGNRVRSLVTNKRGRYSQAEPARLSVRSQYLLAEYRRGHYERRAEVTA